MEPYLSILFQDETSYMLKHLRIYNAKYGRSIEMKKYFGLLPPEFNFVKKKPTIYTLVYTKDRFEKIQIITC